MACNRCYSVMCNTIVMGKPIEMVCDYCGERFIIGEENPCLECQFYWSEKREDGIIYVCHNDEECEYQ